MKDIIQKSEYTASQLKIIANPYRLMVLCFLVEGRKSVSELMDLTGSSQTLMSNNLAVLRKAGIIDYTREHRTLYYYLKDHKMIILLNTLHKVYCTEEGEINDTNQRN